jgi:hypothetical protein
MCESSEELQMALRSLVPALSALYRCHAQRERASNASVLSSILIMEIFLRPESIHMFSQPVNLN